MFCNIHKNCIKTLRFQSKWFCEIVLKSLKTPLARYFVNTVMFKNSSKNDQSVCFWYTLLYYFNQIMPPPSFYNVLKRHSLLSFLGLQALGVNIMFMIFFYFTPYKRWIRTNPVTPWCECYEGLWYYGDDWVDKMVLLRWVGNFEMAK